MHRLLRRALIGMLAMTLVFAGLPLAHAMPCAPSASGHQHVDMAMAAETGHAHHHEMAADASQPQDDAPSTGAPCKCLNCSLCVTTLVAPMMRDVTPERRTLSVRYGSFIAGDFLAFVFIDPGIPILTA